MKGKLWKKALAAAMAMLVSSGALPVKPAADLFGDLVITASADEYSGSCGENVTWKLTQNAYDTNYTLTISGEGAMADYSNSQDSPWWKKSNAITKVDIESGVTSIGAYAFYCLKNLSSFSIPSGVTSIGTYAFAVSQSLTSVTIPDSVTSIGDSAFFACTSLTSISIPSSVTSMGEHAFMNCTSLTSISIQEGMTSIRTSAFLGCRSLTSISIPNSVTSIGSTAFKNCTSLTSISIPSSVTSIGYYTFEGCTSLKHITSKAATPPSLGAIVFLEVPDTAQIYVPAASVDAYTKADKWKDYAANITGGEFFVNFSENMANGMVTADRSIANKDDTVTLTVTPDDGYQVKSLRVKYGEEDIGLTEKEDGTVSFTMPQGEVTVTAEFTEAYKVWVGGVKITADNAGNVFGDGTVSYRPATATKPAILTLNGYEYSGAGHLFIRTGIVADDESAAIYAEGDLVINVTKDSTVTHSGDEDGYSYGIFMKDGSLTVTGEGTLTVNGGKAYDSYGVRINGGGITVETGSTLIANGVEGVDNLSGSYGVDIRGNLTVNGTLTATAGTMTESTADLEYCRGVFTGNGNITVAETGTLTATAGKAIRESCGIKASKCNITIEANGTLTATGGDTTGEIVCHSYGIEADQSIITVNENGTLIANSGDAIGKEGDSYGARVWDITVKENGTLTATSGEAVYISCGVKAWNDITMNGTLTATGGDATGENGESHGAYARNDITVNGTLTATGSTAQKGSHGAYAGGNITVNGTLTANSGDATGENGESCGAYARLYYYVSSITVGENGSLTASSGDATGKNGKSYGAYTDGNITVNGTLTANSGNAGRNSCGVCAKKGDITVNGALTAAGGNATDTNGESHGAYAYNDITVNGTLNATGGEVTGGTTGLSCSYGVEAGHRGEITNWGSIIVNENGTLTATGGAMTEAIAPLISYGASAYDNITVNGTMTATGGMEVGENSKTYNASYGAYAHGNITVTGTLTATGSEAGSCSLGAFGDKGLTVNGTLIATSAAAPREDGVSFGARTCCDMTVNGNLTATSGEAGEWSHGVLATGNITINGTLTAAGGTATGENGESYGACTWVHDIIVEANGTLTAISGKATGENGESCGVSAKRGSISIDANGLLAASGITQALKGTVKNAAAGKGWTNAGTESEADIAINTSEEGQELDYKLVLFPENNLAFDDVRVDDLTEDACYPVISGGVNKVHVGFSVTAPIGFTVKDYGLIYYNSGNVIHTEHLTLDNVGICGIKKAKFWSANITDNGYGVTAVGFVTLTTPSGAERTIYSGELGGSFEEMTNAAKYVTLTRQENKAVVSNGKNKVYVGFTANVPKAYTVEDYGLIYYNSGNVIHTEHLTLNNVGVCGIQKAKYWGANITDNGYGVTAVGFVTIKDGLGNMTTLYTEELGGSFAALSAEAEANAANAVTLTRQENKAVVSNGKNKVYCGFNANIAEGYTVEDYGLIYYNSGNVIHTEHLTLENIGVCGIQSAKYWGANITDNGCGVVCVGFVKVKDKNGYITTLYTEELGSSFTAVSEEAAANAVTLTKQANKAVSSNGKNKVYCGFTANLASGYTVEDYGLIYYNSGNVIHTEHLTLGNVGVCGIQSAKYWGANITDNGFGVVCVGFVKVKDANGYVTTLYTGELGAKYSDLVG